MRSLRSNGQRRLTRATHGDQANATSDRPALDYMGKSIAFDSTASNLTEDTVAGQRNMFQRANPLDTTSLLGAGFERVFRESFRSASRAPAQIDNLIQARHKSQA